MKDLLKIFRWQDGLDILILTFVFYRLYLWLRTKRALRMILAMLALPIYYLLARWIDLPLSVWGLQNLWAVILLVLVVIFQQEIREVLGRITLPSFFFGKPESLPSKRLDEIVEAAFKMAQQGIGGLIILQKEDDLDEWRVLTLPLLMDEATWIFPDPEGAFPGMLCFIDKTIPATLAEKEGELFVNVLFQFLGI